MNQLLARTRAPHVPNFPRRPAERPAPADRVVVDRYARVSVEHPPGPAHHHAEVVLHGAALDDVKALRVAAAADSVRIRYASTLTSPAAVDTLVAVLEGHLLAAGRRRADVRVLLEVEAVVADDDDDTARRRTNLAYAEAFSGLAWRPSSTWLVGTADRVRADAAALVGATGVDAVVLVLGGRSREHAHRLGAAVPTAA